MFAYCNNNPINLLDRNGNNPISVQWWVSTMWWLCGIDSVLPIGDLIYSLGLIALFWDVFRTRNDSLIDVDSNTLSVSKQTSSQTKSVSASTPGSPKPPNDNKKPSLKKLTKYLIEKMGLNPHSVKYEYLSERAKVSLYDLAYDTKTGIVYIITKIGEIVTETDYNISDIIP